MGRSCQTDRMGQQPKSDAHIPARKCPYRARAVRDSVYCIRQDDGVGTSTAGKLVSGSSRDRMIRGWHVEVGACRPLSLQYDDTILVFAQWGRD